MSRFIFMDFCQQAKIYMVIAILSLVYFVSAEQSMVVLILESVLFIAWTFVLNKLCTSGNKAIAWLFAIIPHCVFLILAVKPSTASKPTPIPTQIPSAM
jgi:hypothetical protein